MIRILAAWLWLCLPFTAIACDVCGIFLGVRPNDRRSTIGLFYRSRIMEGTTQVPLTSQLLPKHGEHVEPGVAYETVPMEEIVTVAELRADLLLSERFFLLASLPLTNTYRGVNNYQVLDVYGVGDPFAMIRYQLANTRSTKERRYVHRVLVGAGVKVPLGKNDLHVEGVPVSPDLQIGTGSWDALFSVEYSVRHGRTGGSVTGLARINSSNSDGYHLGNGVSSTAEVFHRFGGDTLSFAPSIGAYTEWMGLDHVEGVVDNGTGGLTVFSHAGIRAWWKRMSFSAYYQHALLNEVGRSITPTRQRVVVGIAYNINKN